jgi:hypothetical protein
LSDLGTMVRELIAAGADPAAAAEIVTRAYHLGVREHSTGIPVEFPPDRMAEKRRAWDRQRKRNSTGIPPDSTGIPPETVEPALYLSSSSKNSEIKKEKEKKERKRGQKIPPEWKPKAGHFASGKELGFTEAQVHEQADDMRLWAESNEHREVARKSDWDKTFLSWLRRNRPKGVVNGTGNDIMATFDRLIAEEKVRAGSGEGPLLDLTPTSSRTG